MKNKISLFFIFLQFSKVLQNSQSSSLKEPKENQYFIDSGDFMGREIEQLLSESWITSTSNVAYGVPYDLTMSDYYSIFFWFVFVLQSLLNFLMSKFYSRIENEILSVITNFSAFSLIFSWQIWMTMRQCLRLFLLLWLVICVFLNLFSFH